MTKFKLNKIKIVIFFSLFFLFSLFNSYVSAEMLDPIVKTEMESQETAFLGSAGYSENINIGNVVAAVIQTFLGLLGIIFIVLIVMAGYKWMNAAGNDEKVQEAKDTIRRAIIGLIITVSAYAITYFVFTNLPGGGGTPGPI